jgi:predicted NAD/FAD-dependent oxidoreductase
VCVCDDSAGSLVLLTRAPKTGVETRIDQVVTVDDEELAWIAYDLTWTASGPPTAEVLSVQWGDSHQEHRQEQEQEQHHHHHLVVAASAPPPPPLQEEQPASFYSWNSETSYAPYASYVPRSQEPPIAYSPYSSLGGSSNGDQHYTHYSSVLFS